MMTSVIRYRFWMAALLWGATLSVVVSAQPGPSQPVSWTAEKQEGTIGSGAERLTLTGNVRGRQGDISIQADRAVWNSATGRAELRGNVVITQPGTTLSAPAVDYTSGSGVAITPNGAVIRDGGATIEAGYGEYYTNRRSALFRNGVTMRDANTTLRASSGTYSSVDRKGVFQGNVRAENDSGTLNSDNLTYWRGTDESYATGNVRLFSRQDSTLLEADVLRNRPGVETRALGNVRLTSYSDSTILTTDTLISRPNVETLAIGSVVLLSMTDGAELTGSRLRHVNAEEYTIVTGDPMLIQIDSVVRYLPPAEPSDEVSDDDDDDDDDVSDTTSVAESTPRLDTIRRGDSLFTVRRDTTRITSDVLERYALQEKLFVATGSAVISRGEMTASAEIARFYEDRELITLGPGAPVATDSTLSDTTADEIVEAEIPDALDPLPIDSTEFAETDSLSGDPVAGLPPPLPKTPIVWYEKSQLTGDSIAIQLAEKKVQTIDVVGRAMTISGTDAAGRYDQLAAERILFSVSQDTIRRINAEQRAASMYFVFEKNRPDGVNRSSGDTITILFEEGKASRIGIYGQESRAEGEIVPERRVAGSELRYRLDGFVLYERAESRVMVVE